MITIKGIYDGIHIVPLETIPAKSRSRVMITFVEHEIHTRDVEITDHAAATDFGFWGNEREEMDSLLDK